MADQQPCPKCGSEYAYPTGQMMACPECGHEWNPEEVVEAAPAGLVVKDANGNILQDGDSVVVVKNLPVKGASGPIKAGSLASVAQKMWSIFFVLE